MVNGYNGITHTDSTTNMLLVAGQTIISNWIGPVWWSLAGLRLLQKKLSASISTTRTSSRTSPSASASRLFLDYAVYQIFFSASGALAVMLSCLWLRDDDDDDGVVLWTVLAPKYVNLALWVVFQQGVVHGLVCWGLWYGVAM
jgi:ethanolaminephosphotransferase